MACREVDGSLQLCPLNANNLEVYVLLIDKIEGDTKLAGNPPSEIVSTLTIDELPKSVPPVAIVEGGAEPVSTSIEGKLPI
mmetsp:Transcript_24281/g.39474  ORF Transcript_24281/g.39474 Transcript_24281/m.39474 type:complete len:81 (+) Transcript_24281:759-1001(+)